MSLINRLRAVIWPNKPDTTNPVEVRRWIDALYVQFDKLKNAFTGAAINETIVQQIGLGFPPIPDRSKCYRLEWHCDVQKAVWVETGEVCGGALPASVDMYRFAMAEEGDFSVGSMAKVDDTHYGVESPGYKSAYKDTDGHWYVQDYDANGVLVVYNLPRDMITAMTLSDGWRSLIPGYYHAVGLVNRLRGDPFNVRAEGEMLSRALEATFSQAHQSFLDKLKAKLAEGVFIPGWSDMGVLEKAVEIPGQLMSTVVKPLEMALWATFQPGLSSFTEALPREGAAATAKKQGASDELARGAADRVTGNFGQRSGNPNVAALFRTAGFLNPAVQILYGQYRKLTDPDPAIRAGHWLKLGWLAGIGAVGAAINYLMTSEEDRKRLKERPDAERFREMSIVGRLRVPFDAGLAGSAMSYGWNSVESSLLGDPVDGAKRARALLLRAIELPGPLDAIHPWIRTALEEKTNYSLYFDRNIVPPWMKEAFPNDPAAQVLPNTPETYREMGKWMNASPLSVEYAVRSLFTNEMDDAVRLAEGLARGDMKIREPADVPLVGRLLSRVPTAWRAKSVQELGKIEAQYQGLRKVEGAMLDRKARLSPKEREDLAALTKKLDGLEKYHEAMLDVRDLFLDIKDLEASTAPDKPQRIDAKKKEMADVARKVMGKAALYVAPSKQAAPLKKPASRPFAASTGR